MKHAPAQLNDDLPLAKGIQRSHPLPDDSLALASSPQTAMNPALVTAADLIAAAKAAKATRATGGPAS